MPIPDLLLPESLAPLVEGTIFRAHIHHCISTGSTNTLALSAAAAGAPEGSVFLAEEQVAGRGRGEHAWLSERSLGIYCSVVLRPRWTGAGDAGPSASPVAAPMVLKDALLLSLSAGLAVQSAIGEVTGMVQELRWPNDVLLNGRKVAGVLAELNSDGAHVRFAVVGVGINVNQESFPVELAAIATSLKRETGRDWPRMELAAALLKSLDREYSLLRDEGREKQGIAGVRKELLRRFEQSSSYARGKRVRVEEHGGYDGITEGLNSDGFLLVRTSEGVRVVLSGGVREWEG
jgi:BirA family biotin operon repressor/biotin-[acetyl-CoA-carboxylase] ligase